MATIEDTNIAICGVHTDNNFKRQLRPVETYPLQTIVFHTQNKKATLEVINN